MSVAAHPATEAGRNTMTLQGNALFSGFPGPVVVIHRSGTLLHSNPAARRLVDAFTAGEVPDLLRAVDACSENGELQQLRVHLAGQACGQSCDLTLMPVEQPANAVLAIGRDATLERNLTQALLMSRQLFKDLVSCSSDFAWETRPDGRFSFVSPRGALEYSARELDGTPAKRLLATEHASNPFETPIAIESMEILLRRKDGSVGCFEVSAIPVFASDGQAAGTRGVCRDVTAAREKEAELARAHALLERLSRADELTGLMNRRAFVADLSKRLGHNARHAREGALLFLDLDNFKPINDRYGHQRGDEALKSLAQAIQTSCRIGDLVGRIGGDEFVIWLEDTGEDGAESKARQMLVAVSELDAKFGAPGHPLSVSIGIAVTDGKESVDELIARADEAMYDVKRSGKAACRLAARKA